MERKENYQQKKKLKKRKKKTCNGMLGNSDITFWTSNNFTVVWHTFETVWKLILKKNLWRTQAIIGKNNEEGKRRWMTSQCLMFLWLYKTLKLSEKTDWEWCMDKLKCVDNPIATGRRYWSFQKYRKDWILLFSEHNFPLVPHFTDNLTVCIERFLNLQRILTYKRWLINF